MNGEPLPPEHGGPLRLTIPVKDAIKNIKWIGRVRFAADRPADYWAERGYDWYAGLSGVQREDSDRRTVGPTGRH